MPPGPEPTTAIFSALFSSVSFFGTSFFRSPKSPINLSK